MPLPRCGWRSLGLALALLCVPTLGGSAEGPARPRHSFRHYGEEQGLANPMASVLLQDATGFLWVGTGEGLYRFDGRQFTGFGLADGLPSAIVDALHERPDGTLWVATSLGVARREGDRFRVYGVQQGVEEASFLPQGMADSDGELLIANGHGLQRLQSERFVGVEVPGLAPKLRAVYPAPDGSLWLAGEAGVAVRQGATWTVFGRDSGLPEDRWEALVVDRQGEAWVRSPSRLFSLPKGERRFVDRGRGLPPANSFGSLLVDSRGELWIPTDFGLAHRNADGSFEVVGKARGLTADGVLSVLEDREGLLWVGLAGAGLDCWLGYPSWTAFTTSEGLDNDAVWAVTHDASGALWVGTDAGVNRLDPRTGRWRSWGSADRLGGDCAYALRPGRPGEIWVGLFPGGVALLREDGILVHTKADGLPDERVNDIELEPDGTLWVATSSGLARAAPAAGRRHFERVEVPEGKPDEAFWVLLRDRLGRLWAGGRRGLALLEAGHWRRFARPAGLRDENVACLADDGAGGIWGCYFEPLGALHLSASGSGFQLSHLDRTTGLASDSVQALALEGPRLWIGTSRGVHVLEGGQLRHLGKADGLISDNVNALEVSAEGAWLGTGRGLARYLAAAASPALPAPRVVVLEARLGGKAARDGAQATPDESSLEVSFAGLSFHKPEGLRFRYRLLGLDDAPVETALREVRYARLPPGSYTFEVACRNDEGTWSAQPARLAFRVLPPWYRTWPALLGGLALLVVAVLGAHRLRVRRLVAAQRELEEAVALRTAELAREKSRAELQAQELVLAADERRRVYAMVVHDLKNPLTPILGGLDFVEQGLRPDFGPGRELLDTMRRATRRMLALIESYTQTLRATSHDGLRGLSALDLVSDLALSYGPSARRRGLALFVNGRPVDDDFAPGRGGALLDAPADRVYRVLENLMSNALKYARGEIRLLVEERADRVLLAVENDGPVVPLAERERIFGLYSQVGDARPGTGVGLASARREVEEMRGTIGVADAPAGGPRFELTLPRQLAAPTLEPPRA
jgi:signal transduction histidine kinase/ligand-binding sensor domain-containing protein